MLFMDSPNNPFTPMLTLSAGSTDNFSSLSILLLMQGMAESNNY